MNFAVLQFPASNCDQDCVHAVRVLGHAANFIWHKDTSLGDADAVIVPGGFSYGDYLRCGAIARFSPVMQAVKQFADAGGLVLGICNGFQILCEAGLLPGALIRNRDLQFHCEQVFLKTSNFETPFTGKIPAEKILKIPIAHGEGCYTADEAIRAARLGRPSHLRPGPHAGDRLCARDARLLLVRRPGRLRHADRPGRGAPGRDPGPR